MKLLRHDMVRSWSCYLYCSMCPRYVLWNYVIRNCAVETPWFERRRAQAQKLSLHRLRSLRWHYNRKVISAPPDGRLCNEDDNQLRGQHASVRPSFVDVWEPVDWPVTRNAGWTDRPADKCQFSPVGLNRAPLLSVGRDAGDDKAT